MHHLGRKTWNEKNAQSLSCSCFWPAGIQKSRGRTSGGPALREPVVLLDNLYLNLVMFSSHHICCFVFELDSSLLQVWLCPSLEGRLSPQFPEAIQAALGETVSLERFLLDSESPAHGAS